MTTGRVTVIHKNLHVKSVSIGAYAEQEQDRTRALERTRVDRELSHFPERVRDSIVDALGHAASFRAKYRHARANGDPLDRGENRYADEKERLADDYAHQAYLLQKGITHEPVRFVSNHGASNELEPLLVVMNRIEEQFLFCGLRPWADYGPDLLMQRALALMQVEATS